MSLRIRGRPSPADELCAIRLIGDFSDCGAIGDHQMKHPGRSLFRRTRPARAKNRLLFSEDLRLHEQIAESGM